VIPESLRDFLPPKAVYLGAKVTDDGERAVREIAGPRKIPVRKMKLSTTQFSMVPID
jgi:hypothetical protein